MLLDKYMPKFDFNEKHGIDIHGRTEEIYPVLETIDFFKSRVIKSLFLLRGLPGKMCTLEGFIESGFILLEEKPGEEIVLGVLIDPLVFRPLSISPDEFGRFDKKNHIIIAWNFHLSIIGDEKSRLTTETRILCTGRKAKVIFSLYWLMISRFSGLIRILMLRLIKREVELNRK